jgi:hypothetical protein
VTAPPRTRREARARLRAVARYVTFMGAGFLASLPVTAALHAGGGVPPAIAVATGGCLSLLPWRGLWIRALYAVAGRKPPRRVSAGRLAKMEAELEAAASPRPPDDGAGGPGEVSRAWADACSPQPRPLPAMDEEALKRAWRAFSRREPGLAAGGVAGSPARPSLHARLGLRLEREAARAQCQELSARVRGRSLTLEEVICWVLLRQQLARIEARQEALARPPGRRTT